MDEPKKMTLVQLTFIVAVNMMGSGIIMLPANMARVGAISLLSWIVTALGSLAIAYGFAQAGVLNQNQPISDSPATGMITPQTVIEPIRPVTFGPPKFATVVSQISAITLMQIAIGVADIAGKNVAR